MLLTFVILYLAASIAIGLLAATRVHNTRDFVVAGRSLPLYVVTATVFATWFGSETVLGISSTFLKEGLRGIVSDPFGSSMCLVLVGLFFAAKLYRMDLLRSATTPARATTGSRRSLPVSASASPTWAGSRPRLS